MLLAGDEFGRTQRGNNNAYCQDNEISWLDWHIDPEGRQFFEFVRRLLELRRQHPAFRRTQFLHGRSIRGSDTKDVVWLAPRGTEMSESEWNQGAAHCLGLFLAGDATDNYDTHGRLVTDDNFLLLLNNADTAVDFQFAPFLPKRRWAVVVDTSVEAVARDGERELVPAERFVVQPRSLVVLCQRRANDNRDSSSARPHSQSKS